MKHNLCLLAIIPACLISLSTLVAADQSPHSDRLSHVTIPTNDGNNGDDGGNSGVFVGSGGRGSNGSSEVDQTTQNHTS